MGTQGKREVVHSRRNVLCNVSAVAKKRSRVRVNELFSTVIIDFPMEEIRELDWH